MISFRAVWFGLLTVIATLTLGSVAHAQPASTVRPAPLILISIDGFRADYLQRGFTPMLRRLALEGVRSTGMRPSYPSLTFPNHYTLVTGLYPDHHGIVNNIMEDAAIQPDHRFTLSSFEAVSDARWWAGADPIWVTAMAQGLRTATLFWPGSEAAHHGVRPDLWAHYDGAITADHRVDMLLDWMDLAPDRRPDFLTLYFDQVDHEGHAHGPDSHEVNRALGEVDRAVARLVRSLKARGLGARVNLVIVADHGMASTPPSQALYAEDWTDPSAVAFTGGGSLIGLDAKGEGGEAALAKALGDHGHATCHRKADIPARLHYGANPRVPAVVCIAQVGWTLIPTHPKPGDKAREWTLGQHGFDNADPRMAALFIAHGPAFARHVVLPAFDNVDVYPLTAHALGLTPNTSDGRLDEVRAALAP